MEWYKSSFSADNGACVEVLIGDKFVSVRDSKNRQGSVLTYTHEEWKAFVEGVKLGEFDE